MVHASQKTTDAGWDVARLRTSVAVGLILTVSGAVALFVEIDQQDLWVGAGALAATIVAAAGLGRHASLIGRRSLPRVSLIVVGTSFLVMTPVVLLLSGVVMVIPLATGARSPVVSDIILWGGVVLAAGPVILCAVLAGLHLGRGGRVPPPWGWLALPALVVSVVGTAIKAGIAAGAMMAWMNPWTDLYATITSVQAIGAVVLGAVSLLVALRSSASFAAGASGSG
ncbi:hypothetical protein [Microbacterium sp.]|uniref:hypothetical protein n=1 Tax=Microbacterium sp. TaxID=51671 RepID=UPI0028ABAACF|nr:hypothetical protein [Microbacterium sp.]